MWPVSTKEFWLLESVRMPPPPLSKNKKKLIKYRTNMLRGGELEALVGCIESQESAANNQVNIVFILRQASGVDLILRLQVLSN